MIGKSSAKKRAEEVRIKGEEVLAVSPEGQRASMTVEQLVRHINRSDGLQMETGCVLPDGVRLITTRGHVTIWAYERSPQVYNLKWITKDSKKRFGKDTKYRDVRIAMPYLIVLAVFLYDRSKGMRLSGKNECFFRNSPLKSLDDELYYPALLNCSKFSPPDHHPLSWICSTKLAFGKISSQTDDNARMRIGLRELLHCLLETGYNESSEHHEDSSWFTKSEKIDPRISTIENWQKATAEDSLFVLDIPWLPTGKTLGQITERIFDNHQVSDRKVKSAGDIHRILFNHPSSPGSSVYLDEDLGVLFHEKT